MNDTPSEMANYFCDSSRKKMCAPPLVVAGANLGDVLANTTDKAETCSR